MEAKIRQGHMSHMNDIHGSGSNVYRALSNIDGAGDSAMHMDDKGNAIDNKHKQFKKLDFSNKNVKDHLDMRVRSSMQEYDAAAKHVGYNYDEKSGRYVPESSFFSKENWKKEGWTKNKMHSKLFGSKGRSIASMAAPMVLGGLIGGMLDNPRG
jgi:hypothetical protein